MWRARPFLKFFCRSAVSADPATGLAPVSDRMDSSPSTWHSPVLIRLYQLDCKRSAMRSVFFQIFLVLPQIPWVRCPLDGCNYLACRELRRKDSSAFSGPIPGQFLSCLIPAAYKSSPRRRWSDSPADSAEEAIFCMLAISCCEIVCFEPEGAKMDDRKAGAAHDGRDRNAHPQGPSR